METRKPLGRVLIANRGEIAVRIIRTLREFGIETVAVYSDADADSLHRRMADYAYHLKGVTPADTYLNIPLLMSVIEDFGVDGVHPGYGFLSENAAFVREVEKAGVRFIGPSSASMEIMGDKVKAKALMISREVPVTPGSDGALKDLGDLRATVERMGYPLILKASAGGGGRGMQIVRKPEELETAWETCTRQAQDYFGNPEVFAERFIENPRHIEVQVLCDSKGNGVHLFERDCSVQRRHQKLLEEAPSAYLNDAQREQLGEFAVRAALAANYEGVGTVEFICESPEQIYFMEMNTRIQVEHTVTEEITGIDLVAEQIRVANGEHLSMEQADIRIRGWCIESRINAENPLMDFMPAPGNIQRLSLPAGPGVRIDTHIFEGYTIPDAYDSMIAKLIVSGKTRDDAIARMQRALAELDVVGVPTTAAFHRAVLDHPVFRAGTMDTGFLEKYGDEIRDSMNQTPDASVEDLAALLTAILVQENTTPPEHGMIRFPNRKQWVSTGRKESVHR